MRKSIILQALCLFFVLPCVAQSKADIFRDFLSYYPEWEGNQIADSIFARADGNIPTDVLLKIIPFRANDDNEKENQDSLALDDGVAWMKVGYRITTPRYIAVFALRSSDCNNQLVSDYKLYTFTKDGNLIDSLTCGRYTQPMGETNELEYKFHIMSSESRSSFKAAQYVCKGQDSLEKKGDDSWNAVNYRVAIRKNGKIFKSRL